jgi:hypothetical protein
MSTTPAPDRRTEWRAVVAVRIPPTDGDDLVTSASRRLQDVDGVASTAVETLRALEPGMPATTVTVEVRVEAPTALTDEAVAGHLTDAPGAEDVAEVRPA